MIHKNNLTCFDPPQNNRGACQNIDFVNHYCYIYPGSFPLCKWQRHFPKNTLPAMTPV